MGKKDKNKKKISGSVKTALKTEKKLNAKQKKELAALGEDNIEDIVAQIEREESRKRHVIEKVVAPPSRRVNFTLTAHPLKDELIMLGGEFHDGRATCVYGDMFIYNLNKNEWMIIKAPGAPPPRCGHQAVMTSTNKGELWVFGGEFSSPSESQFYHYRDLWVYRFAEKKWEKILSPGGPSARSGHRMALIKKQLVIFGGFHDNLRDYKYYNDVHIFNLDTYVWHKIELSGTPPLPRSGCIILPTPENKLLIYGGYSKERIKKDVDKGCIHNDMFLMSPEMLFQFYTKFWVQRAFSGFEEHSTFLGFCAMHRDIINVKRFVLENDQTGLKWKWVSVKQSGIKMSPRCSSTAILVQSNMAYLFGGVFDEEDNDEELHGTFYNDLVALDLDKFQWHIVTLHGKKDETARRRRRKPKEEDGEENDTENKDDSSDETQESPSVPMESTITDSDGIFTVTIGPTPMSISDKKESIHKNVFVPCPRINPGLAVKHSILYLYGGMFEDGDRQYTLSDFYSLDCRKLDEWRTILNDDLSSQTWYESSDSSSNSDSDDSDEDEDDSENEQMDVDEN